VTDIIKPIAVPILKEYAVIEGASVRLTCGLLDPKTYKAVNEALERAGGKWNRKARAHLFDGDPTEILETIIHTGKLPGKNPLDFFATPAPVVAQMIERAGGAIREVAQVLEPSAGDGAICDGIRAAAPDAVIRAVEADPKRAATLRSKGYEVHETNFLGFRPLGSFEAILMNPPFTSSVDRLAYITHIDHALTMLAPWGRLVAIAPGGFAYRSDRRVAGLRAFVEQHGGYEELSAGAFSASGTEIGSVLLWIDATS
jgi:predicted RNA methylase